MSAELEAKLLGAILDSRGFTATEPAALFALAGLRPEDFSDGRVRTAWRIGSALAERGRRVDAELLHAAGRSTGDFENNDLPWLLGLQASNTLERDTFGQMAEALRVSVRRRALTRELKRHVAALEREQATAHAVADALDPFLRGLGSSSSDTGTGADDVLELAELWEAQEQGKAKPLLTPTGIPALDALIGGYPPNLSIVCGLPSVGKSAYLGSGVDAQLDLGLRVGLVGLEDGSRWLPKRLLARDLGIPLHRVGSARREGELGLLWPEVASRQAARLKNLLTYRQSTISARELVRLGTDWFLNRGVDVLYVDHGGEVDHAADNASDDHRLRVAQTYGLIRDLAVRVQRPVVVLAHTNRASDDEQERPPRKSELAESSYIERRARFMLGLWSRQSEPDAMRATVIKNTEGPPGATFRIPRFTSAALLKLNEAELVNLETERREESKAKRLQKEQERAEAAELRKQQLAAAKNAKVRQASLLAE